ncbi:NAD(P)H-quinone oxidoreductase [Saccharothrix violaceirubra]|uniref:Putative PIG3 family NAD(P)H quinone oxidoreductase n=1 Tax=Saccharothrix violaceirubra TaxID=413306 RepID=A0A7W7TC97_9PSEU|nr:NAD(P)H-quinone oxidoreductase [Saccharothrix violaceirubra]MBB4969120.1 putative PIG3 family NAD(P)H quinone oxidoreductase [Saccharothrix violaceirubra]
MHAITVKAPGGPDVMEWTELRDPEPGPGEVLLDVAATAVNRADLLQRQGHYPPPPGASEIIGLEASGVVAALGEGVTGWRVGDEVCALLAGGGYATKVAVPAGQLLPVPAGVDLVTAASLPEVACTVWSNLVLHARLRAGETLLVHGGAGGIGTHAIQVGKALGARVAVTAGSADRLARCAELGADVLVNHREQDFVAEVGGADVVLDNMGAAYLSRNVAVLNPDGRLVVIGMQGGRKAELDLGKLLAKRATVTGTGLRARPLDGPSGKARIIAEVRENLWPLVAAGRVKPVVHAVYPLAEAAAAHRAMDDGSVVGKLVLTA